MGDWDKTCREFKGVPFTPEQLKLAWRKLKLLMKEEVRHVEGLDYLRWLRMVIRKLENKVGSRRHRCLLIDARKEAKHIDPLIMLARAGDGVLQEIKGVNLFSQSLSSSFKSYDGKTPPPTSRKYYAPDSLTLVES